MVRAFLYGGLMALIVEDGTIVPNANSYVTLAEADAWYAARGDETWAAIEPEAKRESLLIAAADYLNSFYKPKGMALDLLQPMSLPTDLIDYVPSSFKKAQIMLALAANTGPLSAEATGGTVLEVREKLDGVGETETKYAEGDPAGSRSFPVIDAILEDYTYKRGSSKAMIQSAVVRLG